MDSPKHLCLLSKGTCVGFQYGHLIFPLCMFTVSGICPKPTYISSIMLSLASPHNETLQDSALSHSDDRGWAIQKQCIGSAKSDGTWILTGFPFQDYILSIPLGPANPQQINFTEEPLPTRWSRFLRDFCCYSRQDSRSCKVHIEWILRINTNNYSKFYNRHRNN